MKDIIITGGRDYDDYAMVEDTLNLFKISRIIQGGATGADFLARSYAENHNIECVTIEANWKEYGKSAGPIRNREMILKYPNAIVVAFPGGRGTENCVKQAVYYNKIVLQVHK